MELIIAILALLISTLIGLWTLRQTREQARAARLANVTSIASIERSLAAVPTACKRGARILSFAVLRGPLAQR